MDTQMISVQAHTQDKAKVDSSYLAYRIYEYIKTVKVDYDFLGYPVSALEQDYEICERICENFTEVPLEYIQMHIDKVVDKQGYENITELLLKEGLIVNTIVHNYLISTQGRDIFCDTVDFYIKEYERMIYPG